MSNESRSFELMKTALFRKELIHFGQYKPNTYSFRQTDSHIRLFDNSRECIAEFWYCKAYQKWCLSWLNADGYYQENSLSVAIIHSLAGSGDVTELTRALVRIGYILPDCLREQSIAYLREYGAWELTELESLDMEELSTNVLWLACCDLAESGYWIGLFH